jgi:hypothetical protein
VRTVVAHTCVTSRLREIAGGHLDNDGVLVDRERLANRVLADLFTEHG